jgi:hypothetical protein
VSTDLIYDEKYTVSPVREKPRFRCFASTPLTTESNINIGCVMALDTRARTEFTDSEREVLASLATLVMDFLEVNREAADGRRAARLSHGLSCFVEGNASMEAADFRPSFGAESRIQHSSYLAPRANRASVGSSRSFDLRPQPRTADSSNGDLGSTHSSGGLTDNSSLSSSPESFVSDWKPFSLSKGQDEEQNIWWTFRRAANLIKESLELEGDGGVVILDACSDSYLEDVGNYLSDSSSNSAPVLAISTNSNTYGPELEANVSHSSSNLEIGFLRRLLHRYSNGKLWSFHSDGMVLSLGDDSSSRTSHSGMTDGSTSAKPRESSKATENQMLNKYFPGASQVIFVPLWNAALSQWFGGCFCWNTVENHVFNPSVELSSLLGFGSSIMAEYNRVESLLSNRKKVDFIGSIS